MKSIKTIIGALLLMLGAIGIASCSQEEDNALMQEKGNLLKIRTTVADTRGVITGTTFQKGDEIGICVTTVDGHDYTGNSQNIRATYTGSDWQLERDVVLTDDEAIVYAYYPYNANVTDSIDIYLNPTTTPEQTDYLQGSCQGVSINNTTADIRFNQALTRITLAVRKGANDLGEGVISRVRIENNLMDYSGQYVGERPTRREKKFDTRGKMRIKTGEKRKITSEEDCFVELPVNCTINSSKPQNIDILLRPVSYSSVQISTWSGGGINVVLTIDGDEYEFSLNAVPFHTGDVPEGATVLPSGYAWEAGQQYTYPVTINRSTVHHEAVYMGFNGDDGQPLYWSTINLGATSPTDYGGLYGWGDPTGQHREQWENASDSYYIADLEECITFYGGPTPPENISGTELDVVRELWGENWRMPSAVDFWQLIDNCGIEKVDEIIDGVEYDGYWLTSNINGNRIFFPKAPFRTGEIVGWFTDATMYWTSNIYSADPSQIEWGNVLNFEQLDLYRQNEAVRTGLRKCIGLPIRPLTSNPE